MSVMVVCSAEATTKRRMKRIAKKEKGGDGKPAMELPNSSMPAQEQAKLGSKQDKKKEKEVQYCGSVLFQFCRVAADQAMQPFYAIASCSDCI